LKILAGLTCPKPVPCAKTPASWPSVGTPPAAGVEAGTDGETGGAGEGGVEAGGEAGVLAAADGGEADEQPTTAARPRQPTAVAIVRRRGPGPAGARPGSAGGVAFKVLSSGEDGQCGRGVLRAAGGSGRLLGRCQAPEGYVTSVFFR